MVEQANASWALEWNENDRAEISGVGDLDLLLERLDREAVQHPIVVELIDPAGAALSVGLGREITVLNYVGPTQDPPYFQSVGDAGSEPVVFFYRGEWSEYPPDAAIPKPAGLRALREFFDGAGELPRSVRWAEV